LTVERGQPLSLGIDGGGTRSRAGLAAGNRRIAKVEGGPLQLATMSPAAVRQSLEALVGALPETGGEVHAMCVGAAGATSEKAKPVADWARSRFPDAAISVVRDVDLILAFARRPVIGLVAGTGVVALGLAEDGRRLVADGGGFLLGDRGGAYWTGLEGLRRGLRASDREGAPGVLLRTLLDELDLPQAGALPHLIAGSEVPVSRIARLAPVVCALAEQDEAIAAGVVDDAVAELVGTIVALEQRLGEESPGLRLTGGMLAAAGVRAGLEAELDASRFAEVVWVEDGVEGALALAAQGPDQLPA
jgi:N-acetylglucosamine kinase-like BadF-type ATPase